MHIIINGQTKEVTTKNIADVVGQFCKNSKNIIAEINGKIIPPADWDKTILSEGDAVELVAFVGGG